MRNGRTIAGERERPVADSERMQVREQEHRKRTVRVLLVLAMSVVVAWLLVSGVLGLIDLLRRQGNGEMNEIGNSYASLRAEIVDETGAGITTTVKGFVSQIETDLAEYDIALVRAVLPEGMMRQVNLYIEGKNGYIKVRSDRGAGVQAEDISRMLKYLGNKDFEYIDVRIEGKGYWK